MTGVDTSTDIRDRDFAERPSSYGLGLPSIRKVCVHIVAAVARWFVAVLYQTNRGLQNICTFHQSNCLANLSSHRWVGSS